MANETTKRVKQATRGAKQIVSENKSTLAFYRNMILGALAIYLSVMSILFEFTTLTGLLTLFCGAVYIGCYQFMAYMAHAQITESGQILDSGVDLNMEGGIAEHVKDLIILTSGTQVFSLASNYFWLLWLLAPLRAMVMLWSNVISPWIFAEGPVPTEKDEKKQRKQERKMTRTAYKHF